MSAFLVVSLWSLRKRLGPLLLGALITLVAVAQPQGILAGSDTPVAEPVALVEEVSPSKQVLHQASISYKVSHPLASFEGVLGAAHVDSVLSFDENEPGMTSGTVVIDLLGFSSRNKARDNHARRSLETKVFPAASLELKGLQGVQLQGSDAPHSSSLKASCHAELLLHGQRSDWPVEVELKWSDKELVVLSSFTVLLDDFSIRRDKLFGMAIRNEVPVSVELRYHRR